MNVSKLLQHLPSPSTWPDVDRRHDPRRALDAQMERHIAEVRACDPVMIQMRADLSALHEQIAALRQQNARLEFACRKVSAP